MIGTRPRIFISSTIYDFRDLRSALKYWLGQFGYEVRLSEFNDFTKPLDENAYNACLRAIDESDYYILFIGSRVGGLYSAQGPKVSITRMEYRRAYTLVEQGKLRPVIFVRDELWKVKEDRKDLQTFLEEDLVTAKELSLRDIKAIANHRSRIVNDAEAIFEFIDEVRRAQENKEAVAGKRAFPKGNWVHTYSTFEDVVDVLRSELGIGERLSKIALKENLKRELYSNLIRLMERFDGGIKPKCEWASFARRRLTSDYDGITHMSSGELRWLCLYAFFGAGEDRCSTHFVNQALLSGEFLEYDVKSSTYRCGLLNSALFDLRDNVERLCYQARSAKDALLRFELKYRSLAQSEGDVSVPNCDLLAPLAIADCQQNVVALTVALIKALDGNPGLLSEIKLNFTSPLGGEAERLRRETISLDEMTRWVNEKQY